MSNAKLKLSQSALIVHAGEDVVSLDVSTVANARVAIQTVIKAYETAMTHVTEMKKSVTPDTISDVFEITANTPLVDDCVAGLSPLIAKSVRNTVTAAPHATQGVALKNAVSVAANVYSEVSDMLIAAAGIDQVTLAKSLMAKANSLRKTLDLLDEDLERPLNEAKRAKAARALEDHLYQKARDAGRALASADYAGLDADVIHTARKIVEAKKTAAQKSAGRQDAIAQAKRVARS